jgi:hypothetical protein
MKESSFFWLFRFFSFDLPLSLSHSVSCFSFFLIIKEVHSGNRIKKIRKDNSNGIIGINTCLFSPLCSSSLIRILKQGVFGEREREREVESVSFQ